jgi:hypothetical protein
LDMAKVRFDGEPMLTALAYDGEYVYVAVPMGFDTYIARVGPAGDSRRLAYIAGRPAALCCESGRVYCMGHRAVADSRPTLSVYGDSTRAGQSEARLLLDVELPVPRGIALSVEGCHVRVLLANAATVCTMEVKP